MSEFPQEIINSVVDELSTLGNKKILSPVALSARCFLHPAQSYIFRTIYLTRSTSQDWDAFCAILHHSPTIKLHVRSISFGNIPGNPHDCLDIGFYESPMCKIPEINSIVLLLTGLQAIHFNYDLIHHEDDWKHVLTECRASLVSPFWCQPSITTLSLSGLRNVPTGLINSILKMSQLTKLIIQNVYLLKDAGFYGASQLVNLQTFGLIFGKGSISPGMKKLRDVIILSASRKLRKIIVSGSENVGLKHLPKLKILSVHATSYSCGSIITSLREIVESPPRTLEIVELSSMEAYDLSGISTNPTQKILWEIIDEILQERAFSGLKEIRLLFHFRSTRTLDWDHSVDTCEERDCIHCSIEEMVSGFRSILRQTSERGVPLPTV